MKPLTAVLEPAAALGKSLADLAAARDLAKESNDPSLEAELSSGLDAFERNLAAFESQILLSGPNDAANAFVAIQAGAGGTDACDWASMLARMIQRWAETKGYTTFFTDLTPGDEAGIKNCTLYVKGDWAFGRLISEQGVHRLVRISPFNFGGKRQTSFASIDVTPEIDDEIKIDIQEKDLRVDTYRAGGKGGQHVNKTESAIRITHLPTNTVAQCQNERSQNANRKVAMKMLASRLYKLEEGKRDAARMKVYGQKGEISFGSQIRSYVLHPYQMVKDHRTDCETSQVEKVLDGEALDPFLDAYLKWRVRQGRD